MSKVLRGGSFNLRYGRPPGRVVAEVNRLFDRHRLHFLCVQEFSDYRGAFNNARGFDVVPVTGMAESGIIVRQGVRVDKLSVHVYGDGWITVRGGRYPAATHSEARLGGWLYVRSVHLPTPTEWSDGRVRGPEDRLDDLAATAEGIRRYFQHPCWINARLVAGDWNEPASTPGEYAPSWIATRSGAQVAVPESRAGHGRIDYALVKGARVVDIFKDVKIPELSDHEPVIFRVVKP